MFLLFIKEEQGYLKVSFIEASWIGKVINAIKFSTLTVLKTDKGRWEKHVCLRGRGVSPLYVMTMHSWRTWLQQLGTAYIEHIDFKKKDQRPFFTNHYFLSDILTHSFIHFIYYFIIHSCPWKTANSIAYKNLLQYCNCIIQT